VIIIKENQIYDISININKSKRYIISLSPLLKVGMKIVKAQLGSSNPESRRCKDLSKYISKLTSRRNMEKVNKIINKLLSINVAIKFYMLGSLMKSEILDNVNSKIVVILPGTKIGSRALFISWMLTMLSSMDTYMKRSI